MRAKAMLFTGVTIEDELKMNLKFYFDLSKG